ncbi:MAG: 3-phosphoshikimate 1-carboxyvinyltransferase [Alphaproteobacteria bacterium]
MPETVPSSRDLDDPSAAASLVSVPVGPVAGMARVAGDKSISHRAVLFGALTVGETAVTGLLEGEDVLRTIAAMRALGASIEREGEGAWRIRGTGLGGLAEPADILDMGNSGTAARLLLGVLASHDLTAFLTGDRSLRRRPMARVTVPLAQFGARFVTREGGRLPLAVTGARDPVPVTYALPVPSAQVKSAVLLAGLNTPGATTVIEREPTRDHTERMLRHFGASVEEVRDRDGATRITVTGQPELRPSAIAVPADISSAAFPLVAALICPGSEVTLQGVGLNPGRAGLIDTLREMGADIGLGDAREEGGEPVAELHARSGPLRGVEVPAERAPSMIDEYPVLAVAAAFAKGRTVMRGLAELRVKESDRLAAIAAGLAACGVTVEAGEDWLAVDGTGGVPAGGGTVATHDDHRIAMSFLVLGMAARKPVTVDDARSIATSFPDFVPLMNRLGADIGAADGAAA